MELRQLQSFVCVARHGHITRAARELFLTQPALSQQIRRLERELGVTLLTRTATGVQLTPAGADLAERAALILADVAAAQAAMDDHAGARRGVARGAASPGDAQALPAALAAFAAGAPPVRVALRHGSAPEVLTLLAQGSGDRAITTLDAPPGTRATPLADDPLVLVGAAGELAAGDVPVAALRDRPLVLAERGTALRALVVALCQADGFSPVPFMEASDPAAVLALAHAGLGLALVPGSWLIGVPVAAGAVARPVPAAGAPPAVLTPRLLTGDGALAPAAGLLHAHLLAQLGP